MDPRLKQHHEARERRMVEERDTRDAARAAAKGEGDGECRHCGDPVAPRWSDGALVDENGLTSCAPFAERHEIEPEGGRRRGWCAVHGHGPCITDHRDCVENQEGRP